MSTAGPPVRSPRRAVRLCVRLAMATALLPACGAGEDERPADEPAPTPEASALAKGLLPAEAFGPGATVADVAPEQLAQEDGPVPGADVQVAPAECAPLFEWTRPGGPGYVDVAARSAVQGSTSTVEVLAVGGPAERSVAGLAGALGGCSEVTVTSEELGVATVAIEPLPVGDLGADAVAVRYTTVVEDPEAGPLAVPVLVGVAEDGDRQLTLLRVSADGAELDAAAFTELFAQAYATQAEALG